MAVIGAAMAKMDPLYLFIPLPCGNRRHETERKRRPDFSDFHSDSLLLLSQDTSEDFDLNSTCLGILHSAVADTEATVGEGNISITVG